MAEAAPLWVEYPADNPADPPIVVERLNAAAADDDLARGVIRVVRDAYVAQYGDRQAPVETFHQEFNPDNPRMVEYRRAVMTDRLQSGKSHYWVVRGEEPDHLAGLARTSRDNGGVYLGDIVAAPPWRRGIGSRVLHASLKHGGFEPSDIVYLDGFQGSSVNNWYTSIGFEACSLSGYLEIGATGYQMLQREYATPASVGVGGVVRALEARHPLLRQAQVRYIPTRQFQA